MDRKSMYLLCFIVVINYLSVENGVQAKDGKKSPLRTRSQRETDKINDIVATALSSQFKDKRMLLPVSETHYNLAIAWRGLRRYFSKKALRVISPGLLRDARIGRLLNALMYENHILKHDKYVRPTVPIPEKDPNALYSDDDDDDDESSEEKPKQKPRPPPYPKYPRRNLDNLLR